ncbi:MAG TPA: VCBS domain-containing protein, partial [Allosphingosinicella sp.]
SYFVPNGAFAYLAAGATATDKITYTVRDAAGATDTATATVTITGVNDKPTISSVTWLSGFAGGVIPENLIVGTVVGVLTVADPDTAAAGVTLTVSDPALRAQWNSTTSRYELSINNGYDYESLSGAQPGLGASVARSVSVTPSDGTSGAAYTVNILVKDVDQLIGSTSGSASADGYYMTTWNPMQGDYRALMRDVDGSNSSNSTLFGAPGSFSPDYTVYQITNGVGSVVSSQHYVSGTGIYFEAPVVLDLNGDGVDLIHLNASGVHFDQGADGTLNRTGWVGAADGLLVLDRNGNGTVDNSSEISFVGDKAGATTDLEGLVAFDSNGDGILGVGDARFAQFQVWQDSNQDGISQASELRTLAAAGIVSIDLDGQTTGQTLQNATDNVIFNMTRFTRADGTFGQAGDVALAYESVPAAPDTTDSPATPDTAPAPATPPGQVIAQRYAKKSNRYTISAEGGRLYLHRKRAGGETAADGGLIGPSTLLTFKNRTYGLAAPIILDLDGDGVETRSIKKSEARFDMDGDGDRDDTGWTGKGDGFLVIDRNGDGRIEGRSELSPSGAGAAAGGFGSLVQLDANRDGKLDSSDAGFASLSVWRDRNGNGITDRGELQTLAEHGIASIGLSAVPTRQSVDVGDNLITATASFTRADGSVGALAEAALAYRPTAGGGSPAAETGPEALVSQVMALRAAHDAGDPRLALIMQNMAAFGVRQGEGSRDRLSTELPRFEYHAV